MFTSFPSDASGEVTTVDRKSLAARKAYLESCSEKLLLDTAIEVLKLRGWKIHHCRPARTNAGYVTPIQGHVGFPDLVCARRGRVVFVEAKSQKGALSPAQVEWRDELSDGDVEYYVLRPSSLDSFIAIVS